MVVLCCQFQVGNIFDYVGYIVKMDEWCIENYQCIGGLQFIDDCFGEVVALFIIYIYFLVVGNNLFVFCYNLFLNGFFFEFFFFGVFYMSWDMVFWVILFGVFFFGVFFFCQWFRLWVVVFSEWCGGLQFQDFKYFQVFVCSGVGGGEQFVFCKDRFGFCYKVQCLFFFGY